jgi:hypothetical protein
MDRALASMSAAAGVEGLDLAQLIPYPAPAAIRQSDAHEKTLA